MRAISQEEELARTAELLSAVRLEFQAEQDKARTSNQHIALGEHALHQKEPPVLSANSHAEEVPKTASQGQEGECLGQDTISMALENQRTQSKNDEIRTVIKDQNLCCEAISKSAPSSHLNSDQQISRNNTEGGTESALDNCNDTLVDAFQKVTIGDGDNSEKVLEKEQNVSKHKGNIFGSLHPRTPHYIEVLESRAKNPVIKKSKFKTNA